MINKIFLLIIYIQYLLIKTVSAIEENEEEEWIEESELNLRERLDNIKFLNNEWPLKARIMNRLPKNNDMICEPTHGRKGARNENCYAQNICYSLKRHQIELSNDDLEAYNKLYGGESNYREPFSFPPNYKTNSHVKVIQYRFNETDNGDERRNENLKILYIENPTILFGGFVPNNLMHVLHDDLIPILLTIAGAEEFLEDENGLPRLLVSTDKYGIRFKDIFDWLGQHHNIYTLPSLMPENLKNNGQGDISHVCFKSAVLGLSTSAQWYQYGFIFPQGPVRDLNPEFVGRNVRIVTDWLKTRLGFGLESQKSFISIVSRKMTRMILNENDLISDVQAAFPEYIVKVISEESMPVTDLISVVHNSVALIGMHGATLSLSQFLPPNSTLVEMYPFGIDPDRYTPYKTLTGLPGMKIAYRSWVNPYEEAPFNIDHASKCYYHGGIAHLPLSYQNGIRATKIVPIHKCCYSPFWFFRIYQDTHVNTTEIVKLLRSGMDDF